MIEGNELRLRVSCQNISADKETQIAPLLNKCRLGHLLSPGWT